MTFLELTAHMRRYIDLLPGCTMGGLTSNLYVVLAVVVAALQVCLIASCVVLLRTRREALVQKNAMLRALPDMMFLMSRDGTYLDYHARDPTELLGPPSSFLGRNMREIL